MRLIDADELKRQFVGGTAIRDIIDDAPTIEPTRGEWLFTEYDYFDCSVCGEAYYNGCETTEQAKRHLEHRYTYRFCPHCGAYMLGAGSATLK